MSSGQPDQNQPKPSIFQSTWNIISKYLPWQQDGAPENLPSQTIKNRAIMHFDELPRGAIVSLPQDGEPIRQMINIPVNPKECPRWEARYASELSAELLVERGGKTLDSALFLIAQAIEFDRYQQKIRGETPIRDLALKPFSENGTIRFWGFSEENPTMLELNLEAHEVVMGELYLSDYFRTVGAILSIGAEAELRSDEYHGNPASRSRSLAFAHSATASRLDMVDRYLRELESGSPEDKLVWSAALQRHSTFSRYKSSVHDVATTLLGLIDASQKNFFIECESTASQRILESHQSFFRETVAILSKIRVETMIPPCIFKTDANGIPKHILGYHEAITTNSEGIFVQADYLDDVEIPDYYLTSPEGREKLIRFINENRELWRTHIHLEPNVIEKALRDSLTELSGRLQQYVEARDRYDNMFADHHVNQ